MLNFAGERDIQSQNILELSGLEVAEGTDLENNPLDIVMNMPMGENESLLPVAFDGTHFRVIGDAESVGGETHVHIRELPMPAPGDGGAIASPFGDGHGEDRSLFKALKMAFFKVALGRNDQNELSWVEYQPDGSIAQRTDGLQAKVAHADNIIVVLSGIIGNAARIVENFELIKRDDGSSLKECYDLVLAYDYENLNTPLEQTAADLKAKLEACGFGPNDNKRLTILGSSMGGLIARWMIEQLGGNQMVDHAILVGAPNMGSRFGEVEVARKYLANFLDIALNFMPALIPASAFVLKALEFSGEILHTLGQMKPGSPFLQTLNQSPDPNVPYSLISGDVNKYDSQGEGFGSFKEKIFKKLGDAVYSNNIEHDVCVSRESVLNSEVFNARKHQPHAYATACHHLNYYVSDDGVKVIGKMNLQH